MRSHADPAGAANKYIAFSVALAGITDVLSEWGFLFIVCSGGRLYQFEERDMQAKMDMLFTKNLYQLAVQIARAQQHDEDSIAEIFFKYGEHLREKVRGADLAMSRRPRPAVVTAARVARQGDYDGAMRQYISTIGHREPSYVIRLFLDAQQIHNLTSYLQALHERGYANADHTTLLLNCYTKLKVRLGCVGRTGTPHAAATGPATCLIIHAQDAARVDEFISKKDISFDVDTAIKVCRQAGFHQQAIFLAKKYKKHDICLRILLEDDKVAPGPNARAAAVGRRLSRVLHRAEVQGSAGVHPHAAREHRTRDAHRAWEGPGQPVTGTNHGAPAGAVRRCRAERATRANVRCSRSGQRGGANGAATEGFHRSLREPVALADAVSRACHSICANG